MKHFEINFTFQHRRHQAEVTVINGSDHIQYTISPKDEQLLKEYGNQVIHKFTGKPMEPAFPASTEEKKAYSEALTTGLQHFLDKNPERK